MLHGLAAAALLASALVSHGQSSSSSFALRDGDRVVFYGDSITAQRLYTRFTEDYVVSRYPQMHISFYNAGVSGDTVEGGHAGDMETRVRRDVVPWHPTVVTIMLGMNDGRYTTEYDPNFKAYADGYRKLIATLRTSVPGARLFLIEPSPYDEVGHPAAIAGYNSVMMRYGQFVAQLGKEDGIPVIDFNAPMTEAVRAAMAIDPTVAGSLLPDRIHPSPAGHWIMATALASGWGLSPIVSSVTLHADGTSEDAENTSVSGISADKDGLSWTQTDKAVPLPLELNDAITQVLLRISRLGAMDQEMLRVSGLSAPKYLLTIDQQNVGKFSAEQLAQGINLALQQTPIEQAAKAVDWTSDDRAKVSGARFDLLTEKADIPQREAGLEALDALDQHMIDHEYEAAAPRAHRFELKAEP